MTDRPRAEELTHEHGWLADGDHGPFGLAAGAAAMVAATLAAAALFPPDQVPARLIVVAAAAGVCAAVLTPARIVVAVTGLGYLLSTGFLVNSYGQLTWDGLMGHGHLFVLAAATVIGLGYRRIRVVQADAAFDDELRELLASAGPATDDGPRPGR